MEALMENLCGFKNELTGILADSTNPELTKGIIEFISRCIQMCHNISEDHNRELSRSLLQGKVDAYEFVFRQHTSHI